ncbi:cytochrome P450 [Aspergillus heterothallicus]
MHSSLQELVYPAAILTLIGISFIALAVVLSDFLDGWRKRRALGGIPIIDEGSYMSRRLRWNVRPFNPETALADAYNKYSKAGKPFAARIQNDEYAIALPPSSCKEWRVLGYEKLSFLHALSEFADLGLHMDVTGRTPIEAVHSCNNEPTLRAFQEYLSTVTDGHLPMVFDPPLPKEWIELNTMKGVFSVTSAIATSLLLGTNTPNASSITAAAMAYNDAMMETRRLRIEYPWILRRLVWHFAPACRVLRYHRNNLHKLLTVEVTTRIREARFGKEPAFQRRPFSLIDVLIEASFKNNSLDRETRGGNEDQAVYLLVQQICLLHFELARPTGMNVILMLYAIMNHREYIKPLRDEMTEALQLFGGKWSFDILKNAPKLESFARETFRMHEISVFVGFRRVMQPLHLKSINLSLKPGTLIMTPCRAVHNDPDNYTDPQTFDGYRFYNATSNSCAPRVTTTSPTFLSFSHGTVSCPGRNLATQITRILFIQILLRYDVKLAHEKMPPYGFHDGAIFFPNPGVTMRVKRKEGVN